jgi:hypothetical protein
MNAKKQDIIVLIVLLFVGILYAYLTKNLFIGKALFAGGVFTLLPVAYLGYRKKKNWKKIIVSTLVFGALFGFGFEFMMEYNKAYAVISSAFPFKILGILPLDNVLGHMMMTCLTVTFYEHFIDREIHHHISRHLKYAVLPAAAVISMFIIFYFIHPNVLAMKYPYLYAGLAAILPPIYLAYRKPKFIKNMAETAIYFFFLYFVIEIIAVNFDYWIYPGNNYVGWVTFLNITFPFEELFFWMMFYAATLVSYYELFVDTE